MLGKVTVNHGNGNGIGNVVEETVQVQERMQIEKKNGEVRVGNRPSNRYFKAAMNERKAARKLICSYFVTFQSFARPHSKFRSFLLQLVMATTAIFDDFLGYVS